MNNLLQITHELSGRRHPGLRFVSFILSSVHGVIAPSLPAHLSLSLFISYSGLCKLMIDPVLMTLKTIRHLSECLSHSQVFCSHYLGLVIPGISNWLCIICV